MKLPKECKVEMAASKDQYRYSITQAYLEVNGDGTGRVAATNGRILAVVPVETHEQDVSGYVSEAALKASRKGKQADGSIICSDFLETLDGAKLPRPNLRFFPNIDQIIPEKGESITGCKRVKIRIDAELLYSLASAIGSDGVELEMQVEEFGMNVSRPILVSPCDTDRRKAKAPDAFGVIMPMR